MTRQEPTPNSIFHLEHDACGVGFLVHIKGKKSHQIIRDALQILLNLDHRGACGCEANTGDGAGILIQMPDKFLRKVASACRITLPPFKHYGAGMVSLPPDAAARAHCESVFEKIVAEEGQSSLGWRTVPTDNSSLGRPRKKPSPSSARFSSGADSPVKRRHGLRAQAVCQIFPYSGAQKINIFLHPLPLFKNFYL